MDYEGIKALFWIARRSYSRDFLTYGWRQATAERIKAQTGCNRRSVNSVDSKTTA